MELATHDGAVVLEVSDALEDTIHQGVLLTEVAIRDVLRTRHESSSAALVDQRALDYTVRCVAAGRLDAITGAIDLQDGRRILEVCARLPGVLPSIGDLVEIQRSGERAVVSARWGDILTLADGAEYSVYAVGPIPAPPLPIP